MSPTSGDAPGPVLVTGMHRSGTSLVARLLRSSGLRLGADTDLRGPAPDNPAGFFEHSALVDLGEDLLEACGGAWDLPPGLGPRSAGDPRVAHLRQRAIDLTGALAGPGPWGWKDPRASFSIPFWRDLLPTLRIVVCVRNPLEVAVSLKRRNQISFALGLALWDAHHRAIVEATEPGERLVTHHGAHFRGPEESRRLCERLGLEPLHPTVAGLEPALRRNVADLALADAGVDPATIELYRSLCQESGHEPADPPSTGRLDRSAIELSLVRGHLESRDRHVAALEAERDSLSERVAALEARLGEAGA